VGGNLIPNADFAQGLRGWDCTPTGVTLVSSERKRFVLLNGGRLAAAICSDPIEVLPGAHYILRVERALPGECQLAMISRERVLEPDLNEEVVPQESPVRIQVTAPKGKKVGVSRVALEPVGYRLKIQNVRTTYMFVPPQSPFEILCDLKNTGSEPIRGAVAILYSDSLRLSEEYRHTLTLPEIPIGGGVTGKWLVLSQTRALAKFQIEIQYEGGVVTTEGVTLKHTPRLPPTSLLSSIAGGARWFSIGSRGLRVTAHETDMDFGPLLVSLDKGRNFHPTPLGVLHHIAQVVASDGTRYPLWSRLKRRAPRGIELAGKNSVAEWRLHLAPEHAERGIVFRLNLRILRRLAMTPGAPSTAWVEFGPFQTIHSLSRTGDFLKISGADEGGAPKAWMGRKDWKSGGPKQGENWESPPDPVMLAWGAQGPAPCQLEVLPDSGVATLVWGPISLIPGTTCTLPTLLQLVSLQPAPPDPNEAEATQE
jgi:hypothetical protein